MAVKAVAIALALALACPTAGAQGPAPAQPADVLREGNTAATAGDWLMVSQLVDPLLRGQLPDSDLAEAHRLAGLAAFFQGRRLDAENHFVAYLRIDLDGQLDPGLYPPEALTFFNDIKARYNAELKARRPKQKRYWVATLVPVLAQAQNGERTKGFIIGGVLVAFVAANITSALVLRSWCTRVSGDNGSSITCDNNANDHYSSAPTMRVINAVSGVGAILTYAYGVYDGVKNYRRRTRERSMQPFVSSTTHGDAFLGVAGSF
ncbi:hypothetical protein BH11MYX3_BH11MYX3_49310 [soil metagenome]